MSYKTNWEENGICWQLSGVVSAQEIFEFTYAFYENPESDAVNYQIVDCINVERFELDDETMAEVAALDYAASLSILNVKVALVGDTPHIKAINQQYLEHSGKFHSNWEIKMFKDMDTARFWVSS
jgi:hypothetical protein